MATPKKPMTDGIMRHLRTLDLGLPPSCIEFCPAHPNHFLIGTYNLQQGGEDYGGTGNVTADGKEAKGKETLLDRDGEGTANVVTEEEQDEEVAAAVPEEAQQSRNGSLILYRIDDDDVRHVQTVKTPSAIFDLHFHPTANRLFGAVSSTGTFIIGWVDPQRDPDHPIHSIETSRISDMGEDVLFTSFKWHPRMGNVAAITTSTGRVRLVILDWANFMIRGSQELPLMSDMEIWCVAISPPIDGTCMIYAGSDDGVLRYTSFSVLPLVVGPPGEGALQPSIKSGETDEARDTPLWEHQYTHGPQMIAEISASQGLIKREHNAGVTAILPLPSGRRDVALLVTGSYDDYIRVFRLGLPHEHAWKSPRALLERSLGGGVWELKLMKCRVGGPHGGVTAEILVSCMHAGPRIVRLHVDGSGAEMWVVHEFDGHGGFGGHTLNYASHFRAVGDRGIEFATTSFYDKKLHFWEFRP